MRIETLGKPRLLAEDRVVVGPDHEVVFALVLALLEAAPRSMSRTTLCDLLWPNMAGVRASHNLRQAVYKLKQLGCPLVARPTDLALPDGLAWDLAERLAVGGPPPDPALPWTFLPGYEPRVSAAFVNRIERWRERVHHKLTERLVAELRQARTRTQWNRAVAWCDAILGIDPLNEEATLTLAEGKALLGSKAEAVALLDRYLVAIEGTPGELAIQPTLLRRRISERMPSWAKDRPGWKVLVGRDALLESFTGQMRLARTGAGTMIAMWGEPGIGKTRLVRELNALGSLEGWSLATISCEPSWPDRPLCALEVMTSTLLLQPGALGVDPKALRALQRLTGMDPDDAGMPQGPEDTAYRQRLLRSSVLDLIDAVSGERPLLIAIDDAQWLDPSSLPFLSMAVEHAATRRVMFVFTVHAREELPKMVRGASRALVSRVPPLTPEESMALLGELVHGQPPADRPELLRRAAAVSNGNPLYMHTLVTHWLLTGDTSELPPSLEALVEQRLDTLAPTVLRCLQVCALLARHSTVGRVETVLAAERGVLLSAMDQLHEAGLLETQGDAPLVRHALIGVRAVRRASGSAVVLLHRYVAEVLEPAALEGTDAALVLACAEHWRGAKEEKRGEELIEKAVTRLVNTGASEAAWAVIHELDEAAKRGDHHFRLLGLRLSIEIAFAQGDRIATEALSTELLTLSKEHELSEDHRFLAEIRRIWSRLGAGVPSAKLLPHILSIAQQVRHRPHLLGLTVAQGLVVSDHQLSGNATNRLAAIVRIHESSGADSDEAWSRGKMLAAFYRKEATTALRIANQRVEHWTRLGQPVGLFTALQDLTVNLRAFGRDQEAKPIFERLLEIALDVRAADLSIHAVGAFTHWHLDKGDVVGARALAERLLETDQRRSVKHLAFYTSLTLARLWLADSTSALSPLHPFVDPILSGPLSPSPRGLANGHAARYAIWTRLGRTSDAAQSTEDLTRLAIRMRGWPRADFVIAHATASIAARHGLTRARRFLEGAIARRFETGDATTELTTALSANLRRAQAGESTRPRSAATSTTPPTTT